MDRVKELEQKLIETSLGILERYNSKPRSGLTEDELKIIEETNRLIFFTHSFGYKGDEQQTKGDKAGKE